MVFAMQAHIPDPAYTTSASARASFRLALRFALGFVALLSLIHVLNWGLELELSRFGVSPRQWAGLPGIGLAPLLHASFAHLASNALPLVVLGTGMLYLYPSAAVTVIPAVYLAPGIAVWLFAGGGVHVGASGLVYGLFSYIFLAGMIRRDRRAIAASLLVSFLYGTLVWGVLPLQPGVSWQTHLAAGLVGVGLAIALRHLDVVPRKRYDWEDEEAAAEEDEPRA